MNNEERINLAKNKLEQLIDPLGESPIQLTFEQVVDMVVTDNEDLYCLIDELLEKIERLKGITT